MNAIFLVSDENLAAVAGSQAAHLAKLWGVDVHLFIERRDPEAAIKEVISDRVFYHYEKLSPLLPSGLPGDRKWPNIVYLRLFAPRFLTQYRRLVYLDVDILCVRIAPEVWNVPLASGLGMVADIATLDKAPYDLKGMPRDEWLETIGVRSGRYANSGFLLIDVEIFNSYDFAELLPAYFARYPAAKRYDQDFLNHVFDGTWVEVSPRFNYQAHVLELGFTRAVNPVFIHICRFHKPWWGYQGDWTAPTSPRYLRAFDENLAMAGFDPADFHRDLSLSTTRKLKYGFYRWMSQRRHLLRRERKELANWEARSANFMTFMKQALNSQRFADRPDDIVMVRGGAPRFNGRYVNVVEDR